MYAQYHTFWRRVGAAAVDRVVLNLLLFACLLWMAVGVASDFRIVAVLGFTAATAIPFAYPITLHRIYGATVGKSVANIRVVDATTEGKITWWQAVRRELLPIASTAIAWALALVVRDEAGDGLYARVSLVLQFTAAGWLLAELITMMSNPRRRSLHDYLAGTVVIKVQRVYPNYASHASNPSGRRQFPRPGRAQPGPGGAPEP